MHPQNGWVLQRGFSSKKFIDYCVFKLIYKVEKLLKNIQKKHCEELKKVVGLHPLSETVVLLTSSLKAVILNLVFKSWKTFKKRFKKHCEE